ncbi:hypothetical protein M758_12G016400 [Ceratodon purpureus]|nr:hypothetical protein M758_12G016400 [Ceratodon purpureus]
MIPESLEPMCRLSVGVLCCALLCLAACRQAVSDCLRSSSCRPSPRTHLTHPHSPSPSHTHTDTYSHTLSEYHHFLYPT